MIYGNDKAREMARSILPSSRRKASRENLRAIKQRHRALVRRELRLLDDEHEPRESFDPRGYPMGAIRREVRERQEADKLHHFEKWAVEVTRHIDAPDGRVAKMRALLPGGLIGDHAMSHLKRYKEFRTNTWQFSRWSRGDAAASARATAESAHARRVRLLREIVASGWGHRQLNKSIIHHTTTWSVWTLGIPTMVPDGVTGSYKIVPRDGFASVHKGPTSPRKLHGLGDIEDFLRDVLRAARCPRVVDTGERLIERTVWPCKRWFRYPDPENKPTYIVETESHTRPNPESHPEWLRSVDEYLARWESGEVQR